MTDEAPQVPAEDTPSAPELAQTLFSGEAAAPEEPAVRLPTVIRGRVDRFGVAMGTGRRKTSVARVRIRTGSGKAEVNGRALDEFFKTERDRHSVLAPIRATGMEGKIDLWVRVEGGGTTGQAGAVMLGVARALQALNPTLHAQLSDGGYLTRDSRMVERKKYGRRKARRSFQFSKR